MRIYGLSEGEVRAALDIASEVYMGGNLEFKSGPEKRGNAVLCTIRCKRGRDPVTKEPLPGTTLYAGPRVCPVANWNAHGYFMAVIFRINPRARITTGGAWRGARVGQRVDLRSEDDMIAHWPKAYAIINDHDLEGVA